MYLRQNEVEINSVEHLHEVWHTGHWYLNIIESDYVIISNLRPDIKFGYPFWFRCPSDWFLSLKETTTVTALIFHVSRCGSTLCKNLLDVPDGQICLNEPYRLIEQSIINKRDISKYMARLNGKKLNVIVKTTSWNLCRLDWLKSSYPGAKTIFIYRNPFEVISSFASKMNGWIDDPEILGILNVNEDDRLVRFARCLDIFMSRTDYDLVLPYENIVQESIHGRLRDLLGYAVNEEKMIEVSKTHSKRSDKFENDTIHKKQVWDSIEHLIPQKLLKTLMEKQNVISHIR